MLNLVCHLWGQSRDSPFLGHSPKTFQSHQERGAPLGTTLRGESVEKRDAKETEEGCANPVVRIEKSVSPKQVSPGGVTQVLVELTNHGPREIYNIQLFDNLPKGAKLVGG